MATTPEISSVTPVRNGAQFIRDAVSSIQSQSVDVAEIHIVDDGSSDGTREIIESLALEDRRIRIHDGPQRGPGPARNVALAAAKGECIAFLDCDDMWPANKLEMQVARLCAQPEVGMVSGFVQYFDRQDDGALKPAKDARTEDFFHVHLGACIYWKSVFDRVGAFDETYLYSEDVDMMLRIREAGVSFSIMNEVTLFHRRHENSMTARLTSREKSDFNKALTMSLMRRKKAGIIDPFKPFRDFVGY